MHLNFVTDTGLTLYTDMTTQQLRDIMRADLAPLDLPRGRWSVSNPYDSVVRIQIGQRDPKICWIARVGGRWSLHWEGR